ncbi:ERF family protein [Paenibacillus elgii]
MSKAQLYKKIHQVMQEVKYLQKDDKVEFGNTKYKAISEEKVTMTVRDSLIKNGLIIIPIEQTHSREGSLSTVDVKYKIVDIDTGEYEIATSSGTGADTQDKGVGKAMTYSYKYLLLRTFAIPTGDDPDKISSAELDDQQRKRKENSKQAENPKGATSGDKKQEDKKSSAPSGESIPTSLKKLYQDYAGDLNNLKTWVVKQKEKNRTYAQMEEFMKKLLAEKQAKEGEI